MATQADVRRIALALPDTEEGKDHFAFSVMNKGKLKGFAWVWMERINPKKPRVANPGVLAARVANVSGADRRCATHQALREVDRPRRRCDDRVRDPLRIARDAVNHRRRHRVEKMLADERDPRLARH
jgi:hypothetical protein